MKTFTLLVYSDGTRSEFESGPGHDSLELDLDSPFAKSIFSILVYTVDDKGSARTIFSAYFWDNDPNK